MMAAFLARAHRADFMIDNDDTFHFQIAPTLINDI